MEVSNELLTGTCSSGWRDIQKNDRGRATTLGRASRQPSLRLLRFLERVPADGTRHGAQHQKTRNDALESTQDTVVTGGRSDPAC